MKNSSIEKLGSSQLARWQLYKRHAICKQLRSCCDISGREGRVPWYHHEHEEVKISIQDDWDRIQEKIAEEFASETHSDILTS